MTASLADCLSALGYGTNGVLAVSLPSSGYAYASAGGSSITSDASSSDANSALIPSSTAAREWRVAIRRRQPVFRIMWATATDELRGDIGNGCLKWQRVSQLASTDRSS